MRTSIGLGILCFLCLGVGQVIILIPCEHTYILYSFKPCSRIVTRSCWVGKIELETQTTNLFMYIVVCGKFWPPSLLAGMEREVPTLFSCKVNVVFALLVNR